MNLKITELELRVQPSTPPKVREQHETVVKDVIVAVNTVMKDYVALFEQALEEVTSL